MFYENSIRYIFLLLLLVSFVGTTATSQRVVVTSGRVVYDAFGRAVKVYHVMLRGIDRQDIFADDQDRGKLHQKNRPYFHS